LSGRRSKGGHTLGVAIELPAPFGAELAELRRRFAPDGGGMPPHVTILAPIDADSDVIEAVMRHLAEVASRTRPFRLVLRGAGTFRPVSPVVFVTIAEGISSCEQLERQVRSGDLAVDTRYPYHPHVTIAHAVPDADLDRAFRELAGYEASMMIGGMGLHEYVDGRWQLLREFSFGG
jgi:2'-5' RNA ligase